MLKTPTNEALAIMSESKLKALRDKADAINSAICDRFIAQGMGNLRFSDIAARKAEGGIFAEHAEAHAFSDAIRAEEDRRMNYHGNLKPIKRKF